MKQSKMFSLALSCFLITTLALPIQSVHGALETKSPLVDLEKAENVVSNGSFESDWLKTGNADYNTTYKSEGQRSAVLPEGRNAAVYQVVSLKANTEYKYKVKIRFSDSNGKIFIALKSRDLSANYGIENTISANASSTSDFYEYTGTLTTKSQTEYGFAFIKWADSTSDPHVNSVAYIDEVVLEEAHPVKTQYNVEWKDEFDGTNLDTNSWEYELGSIRGVEQQHYTNDPENVFVRNKDNNDGELVLKATDRPQNKQYQNPRGSRRVIYNSGSVRTHGKKEFLYGRIEMRAKLPAGKGVFPAFWTLGSDFSLDGDIDKKQGYGWADCGEIDIMELTGSRDYNSNGNKTVYQTIHTGREGSTYRKFKGTSYTLNSVFHDDYHVFGLNWSPEKIEWYVDDKIVSTLDWRAQLGADYRNNRNYQMVNRPQYIQMNLAMGGNWPGNAGEDLAGTEYAIDYVYYARSDAQKAAADAYYQDSPKLQGVEDLTLEEGSTNALGNVTALNGNVDYSITDAPSFLTKEAGDTQLTSVDLLVRGKADGEHLKALKPGKYTIYYTALPTDITYSGDLITTNTKLYKFDRKAATLTITPKKYNLTTSANEGGTVTATQEVNEGASQNIEIQADEGYYIDKIVVDNDEKEVTNLSRQTLSFENINNDHQINVVFKQKIDTNAFEVKVNNTTLSEGTKLKVLNNANIEVYYQGQLVDTHDYIKNEVNFSESGTKTLTIEGKNKYHQTKTIHFTLYKEYQVETSANEGGSITPTKNYEENTNVTIHIKPDTGYHIEKVLIDGKDASLDQNQTILSIDKNHKVAVTFAKDVQPFKVEGDYKAETIGDTLDSHVLTIAVDTLDKNEKNLLPNNVKILKTYSVELKKNNVLIEELPKNTSIRIYLPQINSKLYVYHIHKNKLEELSYKVKDNFIQIDMNKFSKVILATDVENTVKPVVENTTHTSQPVVKTEEKKTQEKLAVKEKAKATQKEKVVKTSDTSQVDIYVCLILLTSFVLFGLKKFKNRKS